MNRDRDLSLVSDDDARHPPGRDWPVGQLVWLEKFNRRRNVLRVIDGDGVIQGEFASDRDTLEWYEAAVGTRRWVDATQRWASFPAWVRTAVTEALAGRRS
jgi:hypothetical protein